MKVGSVSEMRALDQQAIRDFGLTAELLMENAGQAVYFALLNEVGVQGKRFVVFCGLGNNAGDGLVVARKAHSTGGKVKVFLLGAADRFTGPTKSNYEIACRLPVEVEQLRAAEQAASALDQCDVVVDAILGTGVTREVTGLYRDVIELINGSGKVVFSVDIPSGVHGDTGQVMGAAIRAHVTVTFGLPKPGNLLLPGQDLGGRLYVSHISFPPSLYGSDALKLEIDPLTQSAPAKRGGRSNEPGGALFLAGVAGNPEAACLAPLSFLQAGGKRFQLAAPSSVGSFFGVQRGELGFVPQSETEFGGLALQNQSELLELAQHADLLVLGPGLWPDPESRQLTRWLAGAVAKPLLLHFEGIGATPEERQALRERKPDKVVILRMDELATIMARSVDAVQAHSIEAVQDTAVEFGATVVLLDVRSLVAHPDRRVFINTSGHSNLLTAESSEVLAGTIAAMVDWGLPVSEAARNGTFLHGLAADLAAQAQQGQVTLEAIMAWLSQAVHMDREGLSAALREHYAAVRVI